jgi:hypothetical protein
MRKIIISVLCVILIINLIGCSNLQQQKVDPREKEIIILLNEQKYDEAISKATELFAGEDKLDQILEYINKDIEIEKQRKGLQHNDLSYKLEIQSGFTHEIKDKYIYVRGRVKNVSDSDISYFEVRIDFKDNDGNVLNSDYINDGLLLKPNDMREFEIMSKWDNSYKQYELSIGDIK